MNLEERIENIQFNPITDEEFYQILAYFNNLGAVDEKAIDLLYSFYHAVAGTLNFKKLTGIHDIVNRYLYFTLDVKNIWKLYSMELVYCYIMDSPSEVMKFANHMLTLEGEDIRKASAYCYVIMILSRLQMFKEANTYIEEADIFVKNSNIPDIQKFHIWINELDLFAASEQPKKYIANKDKIDEIMPHFEGGRYYEQAKLFYSLHEIYGKIMLKDFFEFNDDELFKVFKNDLIDMRGQTQITENYGSLLLPIFEYFKDRYTQEEYIDMIYSILHHKMSIIERIKVYLYLIENLKVSHLECQFVYNEYFQTISDYYKISQKNKENEVKTEIMNFSMEKKLDVISAKYHYDTLTGCYNRVFLSEIEEKVLEIGDIVVYLDLNDFKKINDTYGHDTGDKQLKLFADILMKTFTNDIVLRLGGDEFVVLTRGLPEDVLQKLDEARAEYLTHNLLKNRYGFSAGVLMAQGMALHEAIGEADKCMYDSKKTGLPVVIKEL